MTRCALLMVSVWIVSCGFANAQIESCPDGELVSIMVEVDDDFAGPPVPASPSPWLESFITNVWGYPLLGFDETAYNAALGHTFIDLPPHICRAVVTLKLLATGSNPENDTVRFDLVDPTRANPFAWRKVISYILGSWEWGEQVTLVLDLSDLPPGILGNTNILSSLQDGILHVVVEDDTAVDYILLELCAFCTVPVKTATWGQVKAMYVE